MKRVLIVLLLVLVSCKKNIDYTIVEWPEISIDDKPTVKVFLKEALKSDKDYNKLTNTIVKNNKKYKNYLRIIYIKDNDTNKSDILGYAVFNSLSNKKITFDDSLKKIFEFNCNQDILRKNSREKYSNISDEEFNIEWDKVVKKCEQQKNTMLNQKLSIVFDANEIINKYISNQYYLENNLKNKPLRINGKFQSIKKVDFFNDEGNLIVLNDDKNDDYRIYCFMSINDTEKYGNILKNLNNGDLISITGEYMPVSSSELNVIKEIISLKNDGILIRDCLFFTKG